MSIKLKHLAFVVGILSAFVTWLGLEVWAVADGQSWTEPFTDITVGFIPAAVGIPLVVGFATWLQVHFISRWLGHPVLTRRRASKP
jgi:hypothetical protein